MEIDINTLTIGQAREIASMFLSQAQVPPSNTLAGLVGKKVIIRTYSAGVWFGTLSQKAGDEVILSNARRMWRWVAKESISLSACAMYGIAEDKSKIIAPVDAVWLQAIEIIPCTVHAIATLEGAPHVNAE